MIDEVGNDTNWMDVRVETRVDIAEGIIALELVHVDGSPLPAFAAGAHIDVQISSDLVRQYSLSNAPSETHRYRLGILNDPESRGGSKLLHQSFKAGDEVKVSHPRNNFELDAAPTKKYFFGGGIGITPLISMAYAAKSMACEFEMHYSTRSAAHTAFRDELDQEFENSLTVYHDDNPQDELNIETILASVKTDETIYICGPEGYIDFVSAAAQQQGLLESQIHIEHFGNDADLDGDAFKVVAVKSGITVSVGEEQTIVEALLDAGLELDVSCEQGVCGTCMTTVLSGQPDHRDMYLDDDEKASNELIMPCCSRSLTPEIKLDI